jgi:hypothetical protein
METATNNTWEKLFSLTNHIITSYRDDLLKHDREGIESNPPSTPFLHFTRETGTNIIFLVSPDAYPAKGFRVPYLFGYADREHILNETVSLVKALEKSGNTKLVLYFTGKTFKKVTFKEAFDIAQKYMYETRIAWKKSDPPRSF